MSSFREKLSPELKPPVKDVSGAKFETARGDDSSDLAPERAPQYEQLSEMRRLAEVLEGGSSSLNQRATTLAGLAVAGIGTFGLFAGRLSEVHGADARQIVAIALVVASFALAFGAGFALFAVQPKDEWAEKFAKEAQPLIEGDLKGRGNASAEMVKMQFERNSAKAAGMRWAYRSTVVALVAILVALVAVAHEATGILT